jgi:beta-glucoside operon transcriptional antiterminator
VTGYAGKTNLWIGLVYPEAGLFLTLQVSLLLLGEVKALVSTRGCLKSRNLINTFITNTGGYGDMYLITKVINNNIVCSQDKDGNEIIVRGLGIGFGKKADDKISEDKIEKIYKIDDPKTSNKLASLLEEVPIEHIQTSTDIIELARQRLNKKINDNIYITLTDHISFAIERRKQKLEYHNALLWEIKKFYPLEYSVGMESLDIIHDKLGVRLSEDEAGFIALHIVNAELDTNMSSTVRITELIQKIIVIVKDYYKIECDESSLHYERFITHLKFFGQRLFSNKVSKGEDATFQDIVKSRYPKDYKCATLISQYVEESFDKKITEEELIFLTIHLRRISMVD